MKMLLVLLGTLLGTAHGEDLLKLVNTKTGTVIVSFYGTRTEIHHPILAKELENSGIFIPPYLREKFDGETTIFLGDERFQKAFVEVYYPLVIANPIYSWENH